jgi:hypothetical protein
MCGAPRMIEDTMLLVQIDRTKRAISLDFFGVRSESDTSVVLARKKICSAGHRADHVELGGTASARNPCFASCHVKAPWLLQFDLQYTLSFWIHKNAPVEPLIGESGA